MQRTAKVLDGAQVPRGFGLDAAAVLLAELDAAKGAEADDAHEEDGPGEGDDETGFGDARVERLAWDGEGRGALDGGRGRGGGGGVGAGCLLGEDAVDEGRFGGGEGGLDVLARGGILCGELDLRDEERLESSSRRWSAWRCCGSG